MFRSPEMSPHQSLVPTFCSSASLDTLTIFNLSFLDMSENHSQVGYPLRSTFSNMDENVETFNLSLKGNPGSIDRSDSIV